MCIHLAQERFLYILHFGLVFAKIFLVNLKFKNKDNKWDICSINEHLIIEKNGEIKLFLFLLACCTALTELVMNDANAQQIVQSNGIYTLGCLILPPCEKCSPEETRLCKSLQKYSFRALRFLFSMERNRRLFKRLFPSDLFEMFINIGHYKQDLNEYKPLVETINGLSVSIFFFSGFVFIK